MSKMRISWTHPAVIIVTLLVGVWYVFRPFPEVVKIKQVQKVEPMILTSSAFTNEEAIPSQYSCDGKGDHPPFTFSGIPKDTKSLAMIVDDPDAPRGTFTHWVIWNIDPSTTGIPEGTVPPRSQEGINSAGRMGYVPPCPPSGVHRYFYTLFALDTTIGLDGKATKKVLEEAMKGHIITQTNLIGSYGR